MKDLLKRALDPGDDGRAFTAAVLLRASGALHRRRRAAAGDAGPLDWLAAWARPWLVTAALIAAFAAALMPLVSGNGDATAAEPASAALLAVPQPDDMLVATLGN